MDKKQIIAPSLTGKKYPFHPLLICACACAYIFVFALQAGVAHASGVPGGNISDPVVKAVDIAKPAVVRIITTIGGRLTVHFSTASNVSATFPRNGGTYKLELSGSGAFISAHGDILTADHVVNPPHDQSLDQGLYMLAAQDVADYINQNLNPSVPFTAQDAYSYLLYGYFLSESNYDTPTSKAYLSTDYTGSINASDIKNMPSGTFSDATIEKQSPFTDKDVAIIHVNMDNTPSIQLGDSSGVEQQDELTIIGFPGNGDLPTGTEQLKYDPTTFFTSSVNKIYVSAIKKNSGAPVIQVGGNVEHGDSGGPALDSSGNIVGVVSFGGVDMPDGTSFLQASSSAQELIQNLNLNTTPGAFQKEWSRAFNDYASNKSGHWHTAVTELTQVQKDFPDFHGIQRYLDYATTQANKEPAPQQHNATSDNTWLLIGAAVALIILAVLLILFLVFRNRKKDTRQAAPSTFAPVPTVSPNGAPTTYGQFAHDGTTPNSIPSSPEHSWQREPVAVAAHHAQEAYAPATPWSPSPNNGAETSSAQPAASNNIPSNPSWSAVSNNAPSTPIWSPAPNSGQATPSWSSAPNTVSSTPAWPPAANNGQAAPSWSSAPNNAQSAPSWSPASNNASWPAPAQPTPNLNTPQAPSWQQPQPNNQAQSYAPAYGAQPWPQPQNSGPIPQTPSYGTHQAPAWPYQPASQQPARSQSQPSQQAQSVSQQPAYSQSQPSQQIQPAASPAAQAQAPTEQWQFDPNPTPPRVQVPPRQEPKPEPAQPASDNIIQASPSQKPEPNVEPAQQPLNANTVSTPSDPQPPRDWQSYEHARRSQHYGNISTGEESTQRRYSPSSEPDATFISERDVPITRSNQEEP